MTIATAFPFPLHWTSDDLADAVPPRVHELFAFDAATGDHAPSANAPAKAVRRPAGRYLRDRSPGALFRIG